MKRLLFVICMVLPALLPAQEVFVNVDSLSEAMGDTRAGQYLLDRSAEYTISEPRKGIVLAREGLNMARKKEMYSLGARFASEMGRSYSVLAQYDSALSYFFIAEGFAQLIDEPSLQASIYVQIGGAYSYLNEYKQALRYYNRALAFGDSAQNYTVYLNTANIYQQQGQFELARENLLKSLEISQNKKNRSAMAATMTAIGENFQATGNFLEASDWYEKALALYEEEGSVYGEVIVLNHLGELALEEGKLEEAQRAFETGLMINEELGNAESHATLLNNLGTVYREKGKFETALELMRRAKRIAENNGYPNRLMDCLEQIHSVYAGLGRYEEAYAYQTQFLALKDSLGRIRMDRQIQELQARFETKQAENEAQKAEIENQNLRLDRQRLWLGLIAISLLVIALVVTLILNRYWVVRRLNMRLEDRSSQIQTQNLQISASNERLKRSNKELKEFAYIVSHDLKEPLRMIGSYVTLIERRYQDIIDDDGKEFFDYATRGVKQMKQLLDDLLKYMVVETNDYELEDISLDDVLASVRANLLGRIEENDVSLALEPMPVVHGNRSLLILLFQNLISNAIKFRGEEQPQIRVSVTKQGSQYLFAIRDNGIGISPQYQQRIFSIFYRVYGKHQYEGTGIGLSICQKIVTLHGGRIWVESEEGKGSTFFFTLGDMVEELTAAR
jgi:signal transduction histidine kinase